MNHGSSNGKVDMSHGSGGRRSAQLIDELFHKHLANPLLLQNNDSTCFPVSQGRMVMTTDAHVVSPLFFPGGDIGSLAVYGTVNDLAMAGARPLYLSASFILEEGFSLAELEDIVVSMADASRRAGMPVICGDTKVVEQGKGDGVFITTTGVGSVPEGIHIAGENAEPGDAILVNGSIGEHGIAILSHRENLQFDTSIQSDSAPLHELVGKMIEAVPEIHCLRDPTRGGLASTLNELASQSRVGMLLEEANIPIKPQVAAACEILGIDPLYVANEGKLIAICPEARAQALLAVMRSHPLGREAAIIGRVVADEHSMVQMKTAFGGMRMVDWLAGEQLPRIC